MGMIQNRSYDTKLSIHETTKLYSSITAMSRFGMFLTLPSPSYNGSNYNLIKYTRASHAVRENVVQLHMTEHMLQGLFPFIPLVLDVVFFNPNEWGDSIILEFCHCIGKLLMSL